MPMPFFKVMVEGQDIVENYLGRKVRDATADDVYHNRSSWSPLIFEDAVRAYHGLGPAPQGMAYLTIETAFAQSRSKPG